MSSNNKYEKMKMKRRCCTGGIKGFRLKSRFSVHRLRTSFFYLFRVFRRWNTNCIRLLRRKLLILRRRESQSDSAGAINEYSSCSFSGVRRMAHSNSFCSEAIADCLEFIKRNSISIDDHTGLIDGQIGNFVRLS